jgi:hypothetical protein
MANSGTPRHSKKNSPGVTIDLAPADVTSAAETARTSEVEAEVSESKPHVPPSAEESTNPVLPELSAATPPRRILGLASGFAGGALALVAGAGLQWAGILPSFGGSAELAALRQEIAVLSEKSAAPTIDPSMLDRLASGHAEVVKNVETLASELAGAKDAQKSLSDEIAALKSASGAAGGGSPELLERLAALESRAEALSGNDAPGKLAEMQAQIAALQQTSGASSGSTNVAQAIAAASLKAAIDRGGSFANELETFATVAPGSPELEQLKNLAASGVPSKADLSAEFGSVADAMLAAAQPVDPNAGLIARLTASAQSLVRSRPVGAIEGDSPEALVARMEVAVNRGDLDAALAEAAKLPDSARAAGIDYIGRVTARRDTDALVTRALTSALSAAGAAK